MLCLSVRTAVGLLKFLSAVDGFMLDCIWHGWGPVIGCCEFGDEPWRSRSRDSPVSIIPPMLHTRLHPRDGITGRANGRSLGTFKKYAFSLSGKQWMQKYRHFCLRVSSQWYEHFTMNGV